MVEDYSIPWLLWIQLLVLFLLIFLLYSFVIFGVDLSDYSTAATAPPHLQITTISGCLRGGNEIRGEIGTSRSRRTARQDEGSSAKKVVTRNFITHPCNYFRLARLAFLKCLGLDFTQNSSCTEETKEG